MEIRELLGEIEETNRALLRMEQRIEGFAENAVGMGGALAQVRYGGGMKNRCRHEKAVLESDAVGREMVVLRGKLRVLRMELAGYMGRMQPGAEKAAVELRYVEGWSCAAIGRRLYFSRQHVYRLLKTGVAELEGLAKEREGKEGDVRK